MKNLRSFVLMMLLLVDLQACNSERKETVESFTSDRLPIAKPGISISNADTYINSLYQQDLKDLAKAPDGGMMEVELGTVARSLHPRLYESSKGSWLPPKQYILLMENFIIENGVLRECFSIKN